MKPDRVDIRSLEAIHDYAEDLRSVTWLAPVSAEEMNTRDRWLADELDKLADAAQAEVREPAPLDQGKKMRVIGNGLNSLIREPAQPAARAEPPTWPEVDTCDECGHYRSSHGEDGCLLSEIDRGAAVKCKCKHFIEHPPLAVPAAPQGKET